MANGSYETETINGRVVEVTYEFDPCYLFLEMSDKTLMGVSPETGTLYFGILGLGGIYQCVSVMSVESIGDSELLTLSSNAIRSIALNANMVLANPLADIESCQVEFSLIQHETWKSSVLADSELHEES